MNMKKSFSLLTMIALFSCQGVHASDNGGRSWTAFGLDWTVRPVWKFCATPYNAIYGRDDFDKKDKLLEIVEGDSLQASQQSFDFDISAYYDKFSESRSLSHRNAKWTLTAVSLLSAGAGLWAAKSGYSAGYNDKVVKGGLFGTALTSAALAYRMGKKDDENFAHAIKSARKTVKKGDTIEIND
jgi:hypothetical protein